MLHLCAIFHRVGSSHTFSSPRPDPSLPPQLVLERSRESKKEDSSVERLPARTRVRAGVPSSSFFRLLSDGGNAVAGGGGMRVGRRRGRGQSSTAAQGFSDVRHQEGVAGQLQHVHAVLLVISQATSDEGLQQVGEDASLVNVWISVCLSCFF